MPDWMEDMQPGDSIVQGQYETLLGVGETEFHDADLGTTYSFGSDSMMAGGYFAQEVGTNVGAGVQVGMDRQLLTQTGSGFVAQSLNALGTYDPEAATTTVVPLVMGLETSQTAAFSGRLIPEQFIDTVTAVDPNDPVDTVDPYNGDHDVLIQTAPEWSMSAGGIASVGNALVELNSMGGGSAGVTLDPANYYEIVGGKGTVDPTLCVGIGESSNDLASWDTTAPYGDQHGTPLTGSMLTEMAGGVASDASLQLNIVKAPTGVTSFFSMAGSASSGVQFDQAVTPADVGVEAGSGEMFVFWWT
jgi:hypothetical protein